jgi:5-methylcytosine-specific restriction endonuclease McrA
MSNWAKGRTPWKGKHHSKETKQKISLALLGKSPNKETRMKQRDSMIKHFKSLNSNYVSPQYSTNPNRIGKWARKERMLRNGGIHSKAQWDALKLAYNYKCLMCCKQEPEISLTRDHIISLKNGGSNDISNIQPLCLSCNSKKG